MLARTRYLQCNTMIEKVASKNCKQSNTEIEMLEHKIRYTRRERENIIELVKHDDKRRRKRFNHFLYVLRMGERESNNVISKMCCHCVVFMCLYFLLFLFISFRFCYLQRLQNSSPGNQD